LNLTWLCTKASHTFSGTFSGTLSGTFSGTLEPYLALRRSLPDPLRNLRNFLGNLVELDPAPAPVHTGAILGYAVGEKLGFPLAKKSLNFWLVEFSREGF